MKSLGAVERNFGAAQHPFDSQPSDGAGAQILVENVGPVTATVLSPSILSRASGSASTARCSSGAPTPEPPTDTRQSGSSP